MTYIYNGNGPTNYKHDTLPRLLYVTPTEIPPKMLEYSKSLLEVTSPNHNHCLLRNYEPKVLSEQSHTSQRSLSRGSCMAAAARRWSNWYPNDQLKRKAAG